MSPKYQHDETEPPFDHLGSPIPKVTDEELRRHVVITRRDVAEIKTVLLGNKYGMKGAMERLDTVEQKTEIHDRKLLVWGSILAAAGTALVFIKDILASHPKS